MKKDQMIPGRRAVLRIAACLGVAVTTRMLTAGHAEAPGRPATPLPTAGPKAAGPKASAPLKPSSYRLQPMMEGVAPRYSRPALQVRKEPLLELPELGRSMVLTFDDGPDPRYTPDILRTLRQYDVRAMFFVCGEMVEEYPDLTREIADDGHLVCNHTWSHPLMPSLPPSGIRSQLVRTSEEIEKAVGTPPLWYRAPYGAWNQHLFEIGAKLGMEPLAWTVDSLDWTAPGTDRIVSGILDGAGPGVVVLSHDAGGNRSQSVAALRRYLPWLLDEGYRIAVPYR
ncbi:polysaccharide deacetylase family protein [Streptomyces sp. AK02-01A]|uniref:polysaccharide deacetylase family protein n=1 Tax=Streptomyces sp. AK02-01A TaxID=3028648 RepID=UPI0029B1D484|nr:polysaccharide deacetylase family protein [Streptomyces sp. AK02-01A]MDX3855105.1 polysaccharide deacetylase family protein [Streptomyces sp. AK02-01A]